MQDLSTTIYGTVRHAVGFVNFWARVKPLLAAEQCTLARPLVLELAGAPPAGVLTLYARLEHRCASNACSLHHCPICKDAPFRPCETAVAASCASGESLRAPCGEPLVVCVYRSGESEPLSAQAVAEGLPGVVWQIVLVPDEPPVEQDAGDLAAAVAAPRIIEDGVWAEPDCSESSALRISSGQSLNSVLVQPRDAESNTLKSLDSLVVVEEGEESASTLWRIAARAVLPLHLDEESPPQGDLVPLGHIHAAVSSPFAVRASVLERGAAHAEVRTCALPGVLMAHFGGCMHSPRIL